MKNNFHGAALSQQLDRLSGSVKMAALLSAIQQADEAKDHYYRMLFRYEYAYEATFHDDPPKAMPAAIEFGTIFEEHPEVLGPDGREMYLMITQMAIDPVVSLPQIPLEQWESMMEQFHLLIKRFNLGHRVYWWQMCRFHIYLDKQKAFAYFQKFWKTGRDALSDCRACERCYGVRLHLLMDDFAGAEEMAKPIKQKRIRFCSDTPHLMLLAYIEDAMDRGDLKTALPYARELKRIAHRDKSDLSYIGAVLRCFAYSDLEIAVDLMEKSFPWIIGMWNQKLMYDFYKGVWTVLRQLRKKNDTFHLNLPEQISCYREDGIYQLPELEIWIYQQAKSIAERFDTRNGTDYFSVNLELAGIEVEI